jgi:hypothetical protein
MSNFRGSKYRGHFWFPDNPSIIARGELSIDKDGDAQLSIEGSGDLGVFLGGTSPHTIFGRIRADYEHDVTLFDTFTVESRVRSRSEITPKITCNCALIGYHIAKRDKPQFRQFDVSMSCLPEWSGLYGFSGQVALTGDWRVIKQKNQRSRIITLNDGSKLSFLTSYDGPLVFNRVKAVTLS